MALPCKLDQFNLFTNKVDNCLLQELQAGYVREYGVTALRLYTFFTFNLQLSVGELSSVCMVLVFN